MFFWWLTQFKLLNMLYFAFHNDILYFLLNPLSFPFLLAAFPTESLALNILKLG